MYSPTLCSLLTFRVKPQQSSQPDYVPAPEVINQNHAFEYALSSAPNVLYARYKQYGQVRRCAVSCVPPLKFQVAWCFGLVFRVW